MRNKLQEQRFHLCALQQICVAHDDVSRLLIQRLKDLLHPLPASQKLACHRHSNRPHSLNCNYYNYTLFLPRGKVRVQTSCSKGCQNPTPRQIQARPNQPWARCSVFIPPPASRGQLVKFNHLKSEIDFIFETMSGCSYHMVALRAVQRLHVFKSACYCTWGIKASCCTALHFSTSHFFVPHASCPFCLLIISIT